MKFDFLALIAANHCFSSWLISGVMAGGIRTESKVDNSYFYEGEEEPKADQDEELSSLVVTFPQNGTAIVSNYQDGLQRQTQAITDWMPLDALNALDLETGWYDVLLGILDDTVPSQGFEEEIPDISDEDIAKVMDWIKSEVTYTRLRFCWKPTYVPAGPKRPADCSHSATNTGVACTKSAPSILADCHGFLNYNMGTFCSWDGDCDDATCPSGYFKGTIFGLTCRCYEECPSGYTNVGEHCVSEGWGEMNCNSNEIQFLFDCYPACNTGWSYSLLDESLAIGPCFQDCAASQVECAWACAASDFDCAAAVANMVVSTFVVATNILTVGAAVPVTAGADAGIKTLVIGGKTVTGSSRLAKAFIWLVNKCQSIRPGGVPVSEFPSITKYIKSAKWGTNVKRVVTTGKTSASAYKGQRLFTNLFAEDFESQTSSAINDMIDDHFEPHVARFFKNEWASISSTEMAEVENWEWAEVAMTAASIVDPTGIVALVGAYAKPICHETTPFPNIEARTDYIYEYSFFKNKANENLCMDLFGFQTAPGTEITLNRCYGKVNQMWRLDSSGLLISEMDESKVVVLSGSAVLYRKLVLGDREPHFEGMNKAQRWNLLSDGKLQNKQYPEYCIGISGSGSGIDVGRKIELHPCGWTSSNIQAAMRWNIVNTPNFILKNQLSTNLCMNVVPNSYEMRVGGCDNGPDQTFSLHDGFLVSASHPGKVVAFTGGPSQYLKLSLVDRGTSNTSAKKWTMLSDGKLNYNDDTTWCIGVAGSGDGHIQSYDRLELHRCTWTWLTALKWIKQDV